MGGLAGHMSHLYDNPSLTFSQMKDIFVKAATGELVGTEKTDGQNLFLSYSVKDGVAKAARNKGNIKDGGMNARELAAKFADRGNLTTAFVEAFRAWEDVVSSMPYEDQIDIFGPDANIYYNAEIQDPRNANVINYDTKNLVIHRVGHSKFDKMTGKVMDVDVSDNWQKLNDKLTKGISDGEDYSVLGNALVNLKALDDGSIVEDAIKDLEAAIDSVGLSDNDTVGEFVVARLETMLDGMGFSPETEKEIIRRIVGTEGATLQTVYNTIPKEQPEYEELRDMAKEVVSDKSIIMKAVRPLEEIVHDFGVEVLRAFQSAFILDQGKEVDRLKKEVGDAIKAIEASGNMEAMEILKKQMQKLKTLDNVSTAAEGFVFEYDGQTYKFTGNFAPINQILGLFKYGRGNVPAIAPLKEEEEELPETVAVLPGGFKPPHVGHLMSARHFLDHVGVDRVVVLVSPKSRSSTDGSVEITADQSVEIWRYLTGGDPDIEIRIASSGSPVKDTYDFIETLDPGTILYLGKSEKDETDTRFDRAQEYADEKNTGVIVNSVLTPTIEDPGGALSATRLRDAVAEDNQDVFFAAMPLGLTPSDLDAIWNIVRGKSDSFLGMEEVLSMLDETEKELDEISVAAGSVGGHSGAFKRDNKLVNSESMPRFFAAGSPKRDDKNKRNENYMIDREEFLQEMQLRKLIRKTLVIRENRKKRAEKQAILDEKRLRSIIRNLIVEAASEDIPHESTGINVLEELLKKIIPVLEVDFKSLTTDPEQRKSFRAHILKAVQNSLAPSKMLDEPPATEEDDDIVAEVDVDIEDDEDGGEKDKFIDIDGDGIPDEPEEEEDVFSIPGEDETGRNVALKSFQKIEKNIVDSYAILSNEKDRSLFYDYLIANLKLYFDKFDDELSNSVPEPGSDIYDDQKQAGEETGTDTGLEDTEETDADLEL